MDIPRTFVSQIPALRRPHVTHPGTMVPLTPPRRLTQSSRQRSQPSAIMQLSGDLADRIDRPAQVPRADQAGHRTTIRSASRRTVLADLWRARSADIRAYPAEAALRSVTSSPPPQAMLVGSGWRRSAASNRNAILRMRPLKGPTITQ